MSDGKATTRKLYYTHALKRHNLTPHLISQATRTKALDLGERGQAQQFNTKYHTKLKIIAPKIYGKHCYHGLCTIPAIETPPGASQL